MADELKQQLMARGLAPKRDPQHPDEVELRRMMDMPSWRRFGMTGWGGVDKFLGEMGSPEPAYMGATPSLVKMLRDALREFPALRGQVKNVTVGPDLATAELLEQSGFGPDRYNTVNLLGAFHPPSQSLSINPAVAAGRKSITGMEMDDILMHELGHAMGYGEANAERVQKLYGGRKAKDIELPDEGLGGAQLAYKWSGGKKGFMTRDPKDR